MSVAENIPVSEETYNQILDLRRPGETLDETLARLVEKVKNYMRPWGHRHTG